MNQSFDTRLETTPNGAVQILSQDGVDHFQISKHFDCARPWFLNDILVRPAGGANHLFPSKDGATYVSNYYHGAVYSMEGAQWFALSLRAESVERDKVEDARRQNEA